MSVCRLTVLVGILISTAHVDTSTHWVVTEDGMLEEQVGFDLCYVCLSLTVVMAC